MKTSIVITVLFASVLSAQKANVKKVTPEYIEYQKKIFRLLEIEFRPFDIAETDFFESEWNKNQNDGFSRVEVVENFKISKEKGFMPKDRTFSILNEYLIEETIAVIQLFYYAKNFDIFYNTAAYVSQYLNHGQFRYAIYITIVQRSDTQGFVLPAPYETYVDLFLNIDIKKKLNCVKNMRNCAKNQEENLDRCKDYGVIKEDTKYIVYANYSSAYVFNSKEQILTYFTEDIDLNSYYYWFHAVLPFWWNEDNLGPFKERRSEYIYFFYKQFLIRYYFERMTSGLGSIPMLSWSSPILPGYYSLLSTTNLPFAQRPNYYNVNFEENFEDISFLNSFEQFFLQFLQKGRSKAFEQEVDFYDSKTFSFVIDFWLHNANSNKDNFTKPYHHSYEANARHLLGAAPPPVDKYTYLPSTFDFFQTSIRDPTFFQLYNKIISYIIKYEKLYLPPNKPENLAYTGVRIEEVKVEKLVTFFDVFEYNANYDFSLEESNSASYSYVVRQPRLNHKPFSVKIDINSEVQTDAVIKIFIAPKHDSMSNIFPFANIQNNFYQLDWFRQKLVVGRNKITRNSDDFSFFKKDSVSSEAIMKLLEDGYVPVDMADKFDCRPDRMMLPKGTPEGFPFQLVVVAYRFKGPTMENDEAFKKYMFDTKPYNYPFDHSINNYNDFKQPNIFYKDVLIYHEGEMFPNKVNVTPKKN